MKLAVNYSKALISLFQKNPELPVDYIKVPTIPFPDCWDQFTEGKIYRPLLPHLAQVGVVALGHPEGDQSSNFDIITKALALTKPPFLSTHLDARTECFSEYQHFQHQKHPIIKQVLKQQFIKAIRKIKEFIKIPLVLENSPYYLWWNKFKIITEPGFIKEICAETDCDFLLDIAHARCTCWYTNQDIYKYIKALPLERLKEVHLSGVTIRQEGLRDTHTELDDDDYELLKYLLRMTSPEMITIEYGGLLNRIMNLERNYEYISRNNPENLLEMIFRIRQIMGTTFRF